MLRKIVAGCALGIALLAFSGNALAASSSATLKRVVYDFDKDFIVGDTVKPDLSRVEVRLPSKHSSLILVRQDFAREIVKAATEL